MVDVTVMSPAASVSKALMPPKVRLATVPNCPPVMLTRIPPVPLVVASMPPLAERIVPPVCAGEGGAREPGVLASRPAGKVKRIGKALRRARRNRCAARSLT